MTSENSIEYKAILQVLKETSQDQKIYLKRREEIQKIKKAKASKNIDVKTLQAQIQAFQMLTRGVDVPDRLQGELINSISKSERITQLDEFEQTPLENDFEKRKTRSKIPPVGGYRPGQSVGDGCEQIISNRISARMSELERFPANIGTLDLHNVDLDPSYKIPANEDEFKIQAVTELKALTLLTKQKALRQRIVFDMAAKSDLVSSSMNIRYSHRLPKTRSAHEFRLTEQLENQQRIDRERKEHQMFASRLNLITEHAKQFHYDTHSKNAKRLSFGRSITNAHANIEREELKRAERTAKQRLQALRSNDEEAYIKLLDQTKDTRITHLLRQTNTFLDSLAQAVRVQQADVSFPETEEVDQEKIDYYGQAHRIKEEIKEQASILVGGKLKEYQVKGLQWMVSLYNNKLNGILADEMGLGKTIQSISLITYLIEAKRQPGPYLVIVPLSTLTNWTSEFEKWAPSVKKIVYKGPPNTRRLHQQQIRSGDFQVLLTTFEYIIKDRPILSKIKWVHMIIDEGHRMKNTQSKLSYTLTTYYTSQYRLILTGTPLQNNLPELWALLNFVLPKIFNSVKTFDEWFNTPFANTGGQDKIELNEEETLLVIRRLHKVLRPFLLRRLKKDVEKDLPDKVEKVIKCKMSALQSKLYEQMLKHNVLFVGEQSKSGLKGLNNRIMQLRKICNHPFVFEEVESLVNPTKITNDNLWRVAGKFELLDRVLPKFKQTGHRVLIFFQMTQVMDIMEDYLRFRGLQYLRLDGSTKADDRSELLKLFNAPDSPYFAFLLSTRAGGLGLNLQTADTVIIYDTDWNPHQDLQAQDRAHRIGQTKEVRILRLITEDSVEEVILSRAHAKLEIDGKVIQAGKFDNKSTAEEQEAFLRSLLEAEEAKRNKEEEDDDIDDDELNEILARSEEEADLFHQLDLERNATSQYGRDKPLDRLMGPEELPEEYKKDIEVQLEPVKNEVLGRGARDRKRVYYDDGLTEEQWLDAVDKDAESLDLAIQKKRERDEKRLQKKLEKEINGQVNEAEIPEHEPFQEKEATAEEVVDQPLAPSRKRSRSANPEGSPAPTPKKHAPAKPSKSTGSIKQQIKLAGLHLLEGIKSMTATDGHNRAELFETLPSKKDYPDYYVVIKKPIALDTIHKRLVRVSYKTFQAVRDDVLQMCLNAFIYNQAGSLVYSDAEAIRDFAEAWFEENTKAPVEPEEPVESATPTKLPEEKRSTPRIKITIKR